jgi:poly[(R)-3-hydroxyalkanoate] polymerase subunit PhaC
MSTDQDMEKMAARLRSLSEHADKIIDAQVGQTPKTLVWTKNKAKLYRYTHTSDTPIKFRTPFLMVYALVNKPFVLDLLPGRSFIEYLVKHGVDVYLLDWGSPGPEDRRLRFDDLVMDYLPRAVRQVLKTSQAEHLNILGYCLGGVLTTLYVTTHPDAPLNSVILLATPIDFSHVDVFSTWLDPRYQDIDKLVDTMGNVPAQFVGVGTKLLKPYLSFVGTYQSLWENAEDEKFVETWGAMNRWIEESVPFAGEAFRQWIKDFYHSNKLINDQLMIGGLPARLSNITFPILNIAAEADHLVPLSQTGPTLDKVSSTEKEFIIMPGGHVGLVTSRKAVHNLWPKVVDWLAKHSD